LNQSPPTGSSPDPIGWASARLFAADVERQQRLVTLRFLGILLETADETGLLHCDPDDLAGLGLLHGMDPDEVTRSRALLEMVGVLEREATGWSIKHFAPATAEAPPAEVMAAIGRVLAKPLNTDEAPAPHPVVVPMEPARTRLARRWLAAPVGAAAAAAVVLIALVASGQMRVPLTSSPVSNSHQNAVGAGSTETSIPQGAPQGSSSSAPSSSGGVATGSSVAQGPSGVSTGPPTAAQVVCPVGSVAATVDQMNQQIDSSVPSKSIDSTLPPVVHTSVTGVVRNNSAQAVVVNPFPVTVNFTDPARKSSKSVTATALSGPTPVAPGAQVPWSVTVENPNDAPAAGTANAGPPTSHWADAKLAAARPH